MWEIFEMDLRGDVYLRIGSETYIQSQKRITKKKRKQAFLTIANTLA